MISTRFLTPGRSTRAQEVWAFFERLKRLAEAQDAGEVLREWEDAAAELPDDSRRLAHSMARLRLEEMGLRAEEERLAAHEARDRISAEPAADNVCERSGGAAS